MHSHPTRPAVPYKISYFAPGRSVRVTGSFWGWAEPTPIDPASGSIHLHLVPGTYEFKFLVDGHWVTSEQYPTCRTFLGDNVRNNVITVDSRNAASLADCEKSHSHSVTEHAVHASNVHAVGTSPAETEHYRKEVQELRVSVHQLQDANAQLLNELSQARAELKQMTNERDIALDEQQRVTSVTVQQQMQSAPATAPGNAELNPEILKQLEELSVLRTRVQQFENEQKQTKSLTTTIETLTTEKEKLSSKLSEYKTIYAKDAHGLSNEDINKYRAAFDLFDKDGDGCITREELNEAIIECGLKPTTKWVQDLIGEADEDASGTIEWPEFLQAMTKHSSAKKESSSSQKVITQH